MQMCLRHSYATNRHNHKHSAASDKARNHVRPHTIHRRNGIKRKHSHIQVVGLRPNVAEKTNIESVYIAAPNSVYIWIFFMHSLWWFGASIVGCEKSSWENDVWQWKRRQFHAIWFETSLFSAIRWWSVFETVFELEVVQLPTGRVASGELGSGQGCLIWTSVQYTHNGS